MSSYPLGQIGALVTLLALTVPLLARYLATVYTSERHLGVERAAYRVLRVDPDADQPAPAPPDDLGAWLPLEP